VTYVIDEFTFDHLEKLGYKITNRKPIYHQVLEIIHQAKARHVALTTFPPSHCHPQMHSHENLRTKTQEEKLGDITQSIMLDKAISNSTTKDGSKTI